jgi:hypothetical protein
MSDNSIRYHAKPHSANTPWVGTAQAVGQRVTPLKRMKAATAA